MDDAELAEKGQREAHTRAALRKTADEFAVELPKHGDLDAAMRDLLAQKPEGDQPGLFGPVVDRLEAAAELSNEKRRVRGRPEGSANLRNEKVFEYLEARGFKNPIVRLMEIISADPAALQVDRKTALMVQIHASIALLPYMLPKKPVAIEVKREHHHVFVAGRMVEQGHGAEGFSMFGNAEQDQGVSVIEHGTVAQQAVAPNVNDEQYQKVDVSKPAD